MRSEHKLIAICSILFLVFVGMCMVPEGELDPNVIVYILFFGVPLIWLDRIGAGIKWMMEFAQKEGDRRRDRERKSGDFTRGD